MFRDICCVKLHKEKRKNETYYGIIHIKKNTPMRESIANKPFITVVDCKSLRVRKTVCIN